MIRYDNPIHTFPSPDGRGLSRAVTSSVPINIFTPIPSFPHIMGKGITVFLFPALSGSGGFLVKDLMLLAAAVWSLGEALAVREHDEN